MRDGIKKILIPTLQNIINPAVKFFFGYNSKVKDVGIMI